MKQFINRILGNKDLTQAEKNSVKADFINFLNSHNCKFNIEDDREEKLARIFFDYQGGHFVAIVKDSNIGVDINYPSFTDAPIDQLQLVRAMCNRSNNNSSALKYTYTFDEKKNLLHVHISFFCTAVYDNDITTLLDACFYFHRTFCDDYTQSLNNQESAETADIERTFYRNERERFIIAQQEMRHQAPNNKSYAHTSTQAQLTLGTFINTTLGIDSHRSHEMTITHADGTIATAHDDAIDITPLAQLLIAGEGADAHFCHEHAVAVIKLTTIDHTDTADITQRLLTITAMPDGNDDTSLYYRLTASLTAMPTARNMALNSRSETATQSMLLAYDKTSPRQKQQEFDYMWQDAHIKMRDGEELSEEQQLIVDITDANVAYCLYWGKRHMLNERFVEAILLFENAYKAITPHYFNLCDEHKSIFAEVCYNLGFCYTEIRQYEKAFYYLDVLQFDGNVKHSTELINCLANNKDIRVFKIINEIMEAINQNTDKDGEVPQELQSFVNFLRRRRAYSLIDFNKLDEAEKAFTEMLDEPENSDYALGELAYIKELKQSREPSNDNNNDTDKDNDKGNDNPDHTTHTENEKEPPTL